MGQRINSCKASFSVLSHIWMRMVPHWGAFQYLIISIITNMERLYTWELIIKQKILPIQYWQNFWQKTKWFSLIFNISKYNQSQVYRAFAFKQEWNSYLKCNRNKLFIKIICFAIGCHTKFIWYDTIKFIYDNTIKMVWQV